MRQFKVIFIMFNIVSICNAQQLGTAQTQAAYEEDIIVTARKKKESIEKVPLSVRQFNDQDIEDAGIESVRDVADLTPNVTIIGSTSPRYITPYIRGQGNQDLNLPEEISVGFYLDEVPLPRYAFDNELIDIQSIEVLRGPQGTLFGRNSQAGSINIYSKDPNVNDGHSLSAEVGNYDKRAFTGTTNFKITDSLQNRLSLKYKKVDGYITDDLQNKEFGNSENKGFNNTLQFKPSEKTKITFKTGAQKENGSDPFFVKRNIDGYPKTKQDITPNYELNLITTSLKAEQDLGQYVVTGIAAFNYYDFAVKYDEADYYLGYSYLTNLANQYSGYYPSLATFPDRTINNPDNFYRDLDEMQRQYYGELRLSNKDDDLSWTTGLNYTKSTYRLISDVNTINTSDLAGDALEDIYQDVLLDSDSFSLFGEGTKQLPMNLAFTLGARLMYDKKDFSSYHTSEKLSSYSQNSDTDFTDYSARASLSHQSTEDINTYFTFARGYQSGGYAAFHSNNYRGTAVDETPYGKSSSLTYELGMKARLFNKKLRLSSAVFFNDIKDKQVRVRDSVSNQTKYINIDTDVYGAEIESALKVTSDLELGVNVGYTSSKFQEQAVSGTSVTISEGARLKNVPYWMGSTHMQYARYFQALDGMFIFRSTYKYLGSRFGDNTNQVKMGSYGLWSFRATIDKELYSITAYIDNAFDKTYETQAYYYSSLGTEVSTPGTPQMYGVKATVRF